MAKGGLLVLDNASSHAHEMADFAAAVTNDDALRTSLVPVGKGEFLAVKAWLLQPDFQDLTVCAAAWVAGRSAATASTSRLGVTGLTR